MPAFHINRGARWLFRRRVDRAGVEQDQVVLVNDLRAAASRQTIRNRSIHFEQDKTAVVGDDAAALRLQRLGQLRIANRHLVDIARAAIRAFAQRRCIRRDVRCLRNRFSS